MRGAVENAAEAALQFWTDGSPHPLWAEEGWEVHAGVNHEKGTLNVVVLRRHDWSAASIDVRPRTASAVQMRTDAPMSTEFKRALIPFVICRLFWPGTRHTALWTKAQIAIYVLQHMAHIEESERAWVWQDCLRELIVRFRGGKELLDRGDLGYEVLDAIVANYVNAIRPAGFQAYLRSIVRRAANKSRSRSLAEQLTRDEEIVHAERHARFAAFYRQRKKRGEPRLAYRDGRVVASTATWDRLANEFGTKEGRRKFMAAKIPEMVELGATEESAKRLLRRWLQTTDSPADADRRLTAWIQRRSRPTE